MRHKIEVRNVSKHYGALRVIDDLSFTVGEGEFVAIVGPSGCGKSTLMKIISGFVKPDAGVVLVDGKERRGPSCKGILISQSGSIFPWLTVEQNLLFGLERTQQLERVKRIQSYIDVVGLRGFEISYPYELSGGMLKRAELARALVVNPEILYMDEPFSALDALTSLRMRKELLRILAEERRTAVLITHDVEEAIHMADRVLVLSARPATIQTTFEMPLAHPRKLASPRLQELKELILRELGVTYDVDHPRVAEPVISRSQEVTGGVFAP